MCLFMGLETDNQWPQKLNGKQIGKKIVQFFGGYGVERRVKDMQIRERGPPSASVEILFSFCNRTSYKYNHKDMSSCYF